MENLKEKYIVKIKDKYASSPASKLTSNINFAGVCYSKKETDDIINYYGQGTIIKIK